MTLLHDVAALLACPECGSAFDSGERALLCERGHNFDVARQGYVTLLTGAATRLDGDTAEMLDARERFLAACHFQPIADVVTAAVGQSATRPARPIEIGAGTGYYLADVLDALPDACGIGVDISKPAARRMARAHERAASVVADAWRRLPVHDGVLTHALSIFAPRSADEVRRVLGDDGVYIVVTPTQRHLAELVRPLGMVGVDEDKTRRLSESMSGRFERVDRTRVEYRMTLSHADIAAAVEMGPSARHGTAAERARRIATLPATMAVTASVHVATYRPL